MLEGLNREHHIGEPIKVEAIHLQNTAVFKKTKTAVLNATNSLNSSFVQGYFLFFKKKKKRALMPGLGQGQGEVIVSSQDFEVEISHVIAIVAVDESTDPDFKQQPLGRPWRSNG